MKKSVFSMLLLAAAAMTTVSCSSDVDEFEAQKENKGGITLIASNPEIKSDTRTEFGEGFVPYWSKDDYLTGYGDQDVSTLVYFRRTDANPAKKAVFSMEANEWFDPSGHNVFYLCKGSANGDSEGNITFKMKEEQKPSKANQFDGGGDFLIAKPLLLNWTGMPEPTEIFLKRVTGIIRLNLNDVTTKKDHFLNKSVDFVTLTTGDKSNDFVGQITVNSASGEQTAKGTAYSQKMLKIYPKTYSVGEKGSANSIYMSVLPTTLVAGEKMNITVQFKDGDTFKKELVAPAGGIDVKAGFITTFNVNFKDADVPAKGSVGIEGEVITMNGVGKLTQADVETALSNSTATPKRVAIKGDINALDVNAILLAVRNSADMIDLDLTDANIKGHTTHSYIDHNGQGNTIKKDNYLPWYLFANCTQLESVELPKSLVEIDQWIFVGCSGLKKFTVQHNVTTIANSMCDDVCSSLTEVYMLCPYNSNVNDLCIDGFDTGITYINPITLYINSDWVDNGYAFEGEMGLWQNAYFGNVISVTVDANGNIQ